MVIFEIRDASLDTGKLLGYLFYYSRSRRFFTELLNGITEWEAPFLFAEFVKNGQYSIGSEWSMKFVRQRIIPPDRQNLGSILKANHLSSYDEYSLLKLSEGRCAQDELFLTPVKEAQISEDIRVRLQQKVRDVLPLARNRVMIFFRDGVSTVADIGQLKGQDRLFSRILREKEIFESVRTAPDGHGIEWDEERGIAAECLYPKASACDERYDEFLSFAKHRLVDTTEAAAYLGCSRQYINQLVKRGKLTPLCKDSNHYLFLRSDLESEF